MTLGNDMKITRSPEFNSMNDEPCLQRILEQGLENDEPIFVLRGQDRLAPALVRAWAYLAQEHGLNLDRFNHALEVAEAMEIWELRKWPD